MLTFFSVDVSGTAKEARGKGEKEEEQGETGNGFLSLEIKIFSR